LSTEGARWNGGWNFGPFDQDAKPVEWICDQMVELWRGSASWSVDGEVHPHEAHYLKLDCSKANSELEWLPQWDLRQALQLIVEWHQKQVQGEPGKRLCQQQIEAYMEKMAST